MEEAARSLSSSAGEDPGLPFSAAKPFLDLMGHLLCTWLLLKTAVVADSLLKTRQSTDEERIFYRGKIHTAQFAVSNFLPQVDAMARTISARDRSILDMEQGAF
jgi:hypothetical protein